MSGRYRFSVRSPDPSDSRVFNDWNENFLRNVVNARFTPASARPAYLSGWAAAIGKVQLGRVRSSGGVSKRTADLVDDADDRFNLLIPYGSNDISTFQNGLENRFDRGSIGIVRMDEAAEVRFHAEHDAFLLFLPKKEILARFPRFCDRQAARSLAGGPAVDFLRSYVHFLDSRLDTDLTGELGAAASRHILELALLALRPSPEQRELASGAIADANLARVRTYIDACHTDAATSLETCCRELGCSRSFLQKLLAGFETSFSDMLRERRVRRACEYMSLPGADTARLIDIAFDSGFSDLSTFHRAFRRELDMTPGDYRVSAMR